MLNANRFPFAKQGEPAAVALCETATLMGNSGPTKTSLMTAVRGGLNSGAVQQAANHLVVVNV